MKTPQQVIEGFIQEKMLIYSEANTRLEPVYAKYFGEPLLDRVDNFLLRDRQEVDGVEQSSTSATVTTRIHFTRCDIRHRYHLSQAGESWKITRIDQECFLCRGTGRKADSLCKRCEGEGWFDTKKHDN
jgi:hypothetical protein